MSQTRVPDSAGEQVGRVGLTRTQVGVRMALAAPLAGALCAFGLLLALVLAGLPAGEGVGIADLWFLLLIWLAYAGPIGLVVGLVLGAAPVVVSALSWPMLERRFGTKRAIESVAGLVAVLGWLQSVVVAWAFTEDLLEAAGWALGAAVVAAITTRWILRRAWRSMARAT